MGIVEVASLAARVTDGPEVTMVSTLRRTSPPEARRGEASWVSSAVAIFNHNISPLHVSELAKTLAKSVDPGGDGGRGGI
jgi:hypothetical protein